MYNKFYIYKFLDEDNNIIYIGRTNDIKRRIIKEHFTALGHLPSECYKSISRIEYSNIENESEQVAFEAILINKIKPKYNTQFKDSANFNVVLPHLKWTEFIFPTEHMLYYLKNRKNKTQIFHDFVLNSSENFFMIKDNLKLGFNIFDKLTPILDTDLILVASDILEDNTLYALNICYFISRNSDKKILYVNLKEDGEILTQNLIARVSHIPFKTLITASLSEDEFASYIEVIKTFDNYNIQFVNLNYKDKIIDNIINTAKLESYDFIIIDDLDSIINSKEIYIKDKTLDIMQKIKSLSLDTKTPILLLSGVNKVIPNSALDYRPALDDLKYNSIRNIPDTIKFLYKEEAYNPETLMKKNIMEVILAKDRFYNQYSFELIFINSFSAIFNMEEPKS